MSFFTICLGPIPHRVITLAGYQTSPQRLSKTIKYLFLLEVVLAQACILGCPPVAARGFAHHAVLRKGECGEMIKKQDRGRGGSSTSVLNKRPKRPAHLTHCVVGLKDGSASEEGGLTCLHWSTSLGGGPHLLTLEHLLGLDSFLNSSCTSGNLYLRVLQCPSSTDLNMNCTGGNYTSKSCELITGINHTCLGCFNMAFIHNFTEVTMQARMNGSWPKCKP